MRIPKFKLLSRPNPVSSATRKTLYKYVKTVRDEDALEWSDIYRAAFGHAETGIDYESNFRAGRMSRRKARKIIRWLEANYPEAAMKFWNDYETAARSRLHRAIVAFKLRESPDDLRRTDEDEDEDEDED
jgi:2,3-bisphosphoglycerate-independent phosphoglycerate mutase